MLIRYVLFICSFFGSTIFADQSQIKNYQTARNIIWENIYNPLNSKKTILPSLYCSTRPQRNKNFQLDHIVAASWMKRAANCGEMSRKGCRRESRRFRLMEADMHNLYPSESWVNQKRGNAVFGVLSGEPNHLDQIEFDDEMIEPPNHAKGKIARSMLYFEKEYNWDMDAETATPGLRSTMLMWHCQNPVDLSESKRQEWIAHIQKTENPYILNPNLECGSLTE